jgi:ubiquinone/menaquinone biosynthesis C-methylase UbiE
MSSQTQNVPQIFEPDYYQRLYDIEEKHWWAQGMRDAMVALLCEPLAGKQQLRVLDVGCGTGYLLEFFKQHYPLNGDPVGVDVSPHALKFCELRGAKALVLGSAVDVPLDSASFDLIICIDTIQHLSPAGADQTALAEFARLLKPGGLLYLRTNSSLGRVSLKGVDPDQYRRYDLATVKAMLTEVGLKVERATYLNALPGALAAVREYLSAYSRPKPHNTAPIGPGLAIRPYSPKLLWLNHMMHSVLVFEAWLIDKLHLDLPFGHSSGFVARRPIELEG